MIANALIITIAILLAFVFCLMGELKFLIACCFILYHQYVEVILAWIAVLFVNVFAAVYAIQRKFFLKDTTVGVAMSVTNPQRVLGSIAAGNPLSIPAPVILDRRML